MKMQWYLWVWGILSTGAAAIWLLIGVGEFMLFLDKVKERKRRPHIADLELKIKRLEANLKEQRNGRNEFGRIIP